MEYKKITGMLIKAPIQLKPTRNGEKACKLILFSEFRNVEKPLKAVGIHAEEATKELKAGDTIEAICHEGYRYDIVDYFFRHGNAKKGA